MADLREFLQRRAADALGGRIGREQLRVRGFQVGQFAVERVVFLVGDRRGGLLVITAVVLGDLGAERFDALPGGFAGVGGRLGHVSKEVAWRKGEGSTGETVRPVRKSGLERHGAAMKRKARKGDF